MERPHDAIDALTDACRKKGALNPVSAETYRLFIEMDEGETVCLLDMLIEANEDTLVRWARAVPRTKTKVDVGALIEWQLYLTARGIMRLTEEPRIALFAPDGPEPTPEEDTAMMKWAENGRALLPKLAEKLKEFDWEAE